MSGHCMKMCLAPHIYRQIHNIHSLQNSIMKSIFRTFMKILCKNKIIHQITKVWAL